MEYAIKSSQIKIQNQIYHGNRSTISVITELEVHGNGIHTAQYMFVTLCKL